jgi:hypothetical protein
MGLSASRPGRSTPKEKTPVPVGEAGRAVVNLDAEDKRQNLPRWESNPDSPAPSLATTPTQPPRLRDKVSKCLQRSSLRWAMRTVKKKHKSAVVATGSPDTLVPPTSSPKQNIRWQQSLCGSRSTVCGPEVTEGCWDETHTYFKSPMQLSYECFMNAFGSRAAYLKLTSLIVNFLFSWGFSTALLLLSCAGHGSSATELNADRFPARQDPTYYLSDFSSF